MWHSPLRTVVQACALGFALLAAPVEAQDRSADAARRALSDSLRRARSFFLPQQLVVGLEVSGLLQPLWCRCGGRSTAELLLRMRRVQLEAQVGYETRHPRRYATAGAAARRSLEQYDSKGYFFRVGAALRLDQGQKPWMANLGLHYAAASYHETLAVQAASLLHPEPLWLQTRNHRHLHWWEISLGMKVRLWQHLLVGYRAYFAFGAKQRGGTNNATPFYAPGYGRLDRLGKFGLRYYVSYRFLLREKTQRKQNRTEKK